MPPNDTPATDNQSFEQALQELEGIVRSLEEGKQTLDDSIKAYERGMQIKQVCEKKLKSAKMKIDQITTDENGKPQSSPSPLEETLD